MFAAANTVTEMLGNFERNHVQQLITHNKEHVTAAFGYICLSLMMCSRKEWLQKKHHFFSLSKAFNSGLLQRLLKLLHVFA